MFKFAEFFTKKSKNEPAYTHPAAKDKQNRYINFEMEQTQKVFIQLVENNSKKSQMNKEYRFPRTSDNQFQRARTEEL